jgi:hypothetical protein
MKINLKLSIFAMIATTVGLLSCVSAEHNTITVNTPSSSPTPQNHQQPPEQASTLTPYPTPIKISSDQISHAYFNLSEINTCELPCFLGITPGKTLWQDTKNLLDPFTASTRLGLEGEYGQFAAIVLNEQNNELELRFQIGSDSGIVYLVEMSNETPLSEYLSTLGLPNQVLLNSAGVGGIGNGFNLAIAYFKRGVIAYLDGEFEIIDGKAQICSDQLRKIQMIVLWSPEDIRFIGDLVNLDGFVGIEATTNTTIEEFYEKYSKDDSSYCFQLNY